MTSATVTERSGSIMNVAVQSISARTQESAKGFTSVMDSVSGTVSQEKNLSVQNKTALSKDSKESALKDSDRTNRTVSETDKKNPAGEQVHNTDDAKKTEEADVQKDPMEQAEDAEKAGEEAVSTQMLQGLIEQAEQLIETVAESFSVETEDVMEAMKQLDMNIMDILNPEQMQNLALVMAGEDQTSLLTNEELYQTVQELTQLTSNMAKELREGSALNSQEWEQLLQKAAAQLNGADAESAKMTETNTTVQNEVFVEVSEMQGMNDRNADSSRFGGTGDDQAEQGRGFAASGSEQVRHDRPDASESLNTGTEMHSFADSLIDHVNEFLESQIQESATAGSGVDTESIMRQIMDYMRIQNEGSRFSEIEMQLHPQSLGTLHISIASKNGAVTAQFAAQNEAVKEALENHVMLLKENLEQQGVKVEAVEVTVASHEFERNLEQDAQNEANQSREAEARKKTPRRIHMDDLGEEGLAEDTDEADRITRDMMMRRGGKLDYLA